MGSIELQSVEEREGGKRTQQLNPNAKEFRPQAVLFVCPSKSVSPPPPPVICHKPWFLSLPPPPHHHTVFKQPNYPFFCPPCPCPYPLTFSLPNLLDTAPAKPPVFMLPSTQPKAKDEPKETEPLVVGNRRERARRTRIMSRFGRHATDWAWMRKHKHSHGVELKNHKDNKKEETKNPRTVAVTTSPAVLAGGSDFESYPFGKSTSLMIRNIPVRLRRGKLMEMLDEHCRQENKKLLDNESLSSTTDDQEPPSEFDFLYLPIDFMREGNKGYAFVNFTNWKGAARLFNSWSGTSWVECGYTTHKIRAFSPARFQGIEALKRHFERSVFHCEDEDYLPVEITPPRDGSNAGTTSLISIGTRLSPQPC